VLVKISKVGPVINFLIYGAKVGSLSSQRVERKKVRLGFSSLAVSTWDMYASLTLLNISPPRPLFKVFYFRGKLSRRLSGYRKAAESDCFLEAFTS